MEQRLLNLRVRPPRLAVLIGNDSASGEFIRVVRFLSQLWGGRYSPILPVDTGNPDPLTKFRLGNLRPDFVYGVGINDERWAPVIHEACQPRQYKPLVLSVAEDVQKALFEEFIRVDRAVIAMFEARKPPSRFNRPLKVISTNSSSQWAPFCAVMFGVHHPDLAKEYQDEHVSFTSDDAAEFVDLCKDFVENWKLCWLDATGFGLNPHHMMSAPVEPTIVLVRDVIRDLAQFWNLRLASDTDHATWIIPVPFDRAGDAAVLGRLKEWLVAFLAYGAKPDYCVVTSESVSEEECIAFATELHKALQGTSITNVDYEPPKNRLPRVLPFEYTTTWPAQLESRQLTFPPPSPRMFRVREKRESWFVDILDDRSTRRAVKDIQLPASTIVPELLNGPCPPSFEQSVIPRFGDGIDSINVRCNSSEEVISFHVPSPEEVLEELLREHGYEIIHDEKRSSYLPTIKRFGGLHQAATDFSGEAGLILEVLRQGTLRPDQIKGKCNLGNSHLSDSHSLESITGVLARVSERTERIGKKRFEDFVRRHSPEEATLEALLEYWADKSIVTRRWEIGPCAHCKQKAFVERLNIQRPILCPNCGHRISLRGRARIGYSLSWPVAHSLDEGIVPVVRAGRFLRNMTRRGFFWLPGVKYRKDDVEGDVDFIACCDGYLIFGECKTLSNTPKDADTWTEVTDQFLKLAFAAKECRANLVVLATQVEEFPDHVRQRIKTKLDHEMPFLLLTNGDLGEGYRTVQNGDSPKRLDLGDLLPEQFPEQLVQSTGATRQISFGSWSYTKRR